MTNALTAAEAFDRYRSALEHNALIQGTWHREDEGRHLACVLGVLGDDVTSPSKCPAQIMPKWLAQQVVWFFDGQDFADAKDWGLRFYAEIKRLNGAVPFSVIHDWQANIVGPLAIEVATKKKRNIAAHEALQKMQAEALAGKKFTAEEWKPILKEAFYDANAYANAYANANANAYANAYANADAYADAYAYTNAYAYADANAYAYADAYADADAKKKVIKRLADGMIECLARVSTPVESAQ